MRQKIKMRTNNFGNPVHQHSFNATFQRSATGGTTFTRALQLQENNAFYESVVGDISTVRL